MQKGFAIKRKRRSVKTKYFIVYLISETYNIKGEVGFPEPPLFCLRRLRDAIKHKSLTAKQD